MIGKLAVFTPPSCSDLLNFDIFQTRVRNIVSLFQNHLRFGAAGNRNFDVKKCSENWDSYLWGGTLHSDKCCNKMGVSILFWKSKVTIGVQIVMKDTLNSD